MKAFLIVLATAGLLGGCASSVQLDAPPVEDKSPAQVTGKPGQGSTMGNPAGPTAASSAAGSTSQVTTVNAEDAYKPGQAPANVSRLIYFDVDSFQIKPEFMPAVEAHARWLKANRNRRAAIEGHTDATGSNEYNLALGQRRADAVSRALSLLGVAEPQLESVSFGEEKPADPGNSEDALAKNRRVEIFYR